MERNERYEVNSQGELIIGEPVTLTQSERKKMIENMFSINGWEYDLLDEITPSHFYIELKNGNLEIEKKIHLYHGNVRKEDPDRNREEKKIQLGINNDPRTHIEDGLIIGFYVYENKNSLDDAVIVAWPIEQDKNYHGNPSLRVNMRTDVLSAKNKGYHLDKTSGKNLVAFRPEFIYHYIDNYKQLQYSNKTTYSNTLARNRIFFGAPGTGKSYCLNKEKDELLGENCKDYERVTFYPDYAYANFVGTYKPTPYTDNEGKDLITYKYIPGPFMRMYVKSLKNTKTNNLKPFLLIIEEINRANVAAVFGDIFQLLDRDDNNISEYPIQASEDIKKHLKEKLGGNIEDYAEIKIPDNLFIWATMNSADQGVYPMDTAFKRRWEFTYLGINVNEEGIGNKKVILGTGNYKREIEWNDLRRAINDELSHYKINEDKLIGPYFLSRKNLSELENEQDFIEIFKSKIIMYLFEDAARQRRETLFAGCADRSRYSSICDEFVNKGVFIFCKNISDKFEINVDSNSWEVV